MQAEKARIVFMGTPDFSIPSLRMLIDRGYNVVLVITAEDKKRGRGKRLSYTPVKKEALLHNIPVLEPSSLRTEEFEKKLKSFLPDLFVTIAYGKIIPANILSIPPYGCINVHASLLPKYRGPAPIWWTIINAETKTGITTMYTDQGIDTGDMLIKKEVEIGSKTTAGELHDILSEVSAGVLDDTLSKLFRNELKRYKQNDQEASYAPLITKETGHINWNSSQENIRNLIRGLDPWPGAYSYYLGKRMRMFDAKNTDCGSDLPPGTIIKVSKDGLVVSCADMALRIDSVQMPDKKIMSVGEYINGNTIKRGVMFE